MKLTNPPGLQDVVASRTSLSHIDGEAGVLIYNGYNIDDLAQKASYEEVAYLLWFGRLPRQSELDDLKSRLKAARRLPAEVMDTLRRIAKRATPMEALRTATSMLSIDRADKDDVSHDANIAKSIELTAQFPTIIAAFDRLRKGHEPLDPDDSLDHAANFLWMLNGEKPSEQAARMFDICLVLHADHGLNASTFAARVIASTLSDMHAAITGAIGALKGPLHGGANQKVMEMLLTLKSADEAEARIRHMLEQKQKVMGFGHRVYKTYDPRARHLSDFSRRLAEEKQNPLWYDMSRIIEKVMKEEKGLDPNVDFYSASTYYYLGIVPDLYTPIFALSRVAGWTAHVTEQLDDNRLIRPRGEYIGAYDLPWVDIADR